PLQHPPPTLTTIEPELLSTLFTPEPLAPGGSDLVTILADSAHQTAVVLRKAALSPEKKNGWGAVEWRHVWCDSSIWETSWAANGLKDELARLEKEGREIRNIVFVR